MRSQILSGWPSETDSLVNTKSRWRKRGFLQKRHGGTGARQHRGPPWLVGHVTKEGLIAGPRVLEHMVDTVLYFVRSDPLARIRDIAALLDGVGVGADI